MFCFAGWKGGEISWIVRGSVVVFASRKAAPWLSCHVCCVFSLGFIGLFCRRFLCEREEYDHEHLECPGRGSLQAPPIPYFCCPMISNVYLNLEQMFSFQNIIAIGATSDVNLLDLFFGDDGIIAWEGALQAWRIDASSGARGCKNEHYAERREKWGENGENAKKRSETNYPS